MKGPSRSTNPPSLPLLHVLRERILTSASIITRSHPGSQHTPRRLPRLGNDWWLDSQSAIAGRVHTERSLKGVHRTWWNPYSERWFEIQIIRTIDLWL